MKNLSLQMTETAALKKPAEVVSQSNAVSGHVTDSNSSFQTMLNKQVQAKNASAKEMQSKQNKTNEPDEKNVSRVVAATTKDGTTETEAAQLSAQKISQLHLPKMVQDSAKGLADVEKIPATKSIIEPDTKPLSVKVSDDNQDEDAILATAENSLANENSVGVNSAAVLLSSIVEAKPIETINAGNTQESTSVSVSADRQRNLNTEINNNVLSHVLSQNRPAAQPESSDVASIDDKQSHANWLDAMLPNATKQTIGDDVANAKLAFNAVQDAANKELATKDTGIKEVAIPANFQSTAASNGATALQPLGSSNSINAYPGKTGWDQAISQKVVWMLGAQEQSATLTLNPPELGPLQVVIHVHNDQADTTFISDNAEVRQALQDGMANLRDKMSESGVQLGQANVNSGGQMQQQFQQATPQSRASAGQNGSTTTSQAEVSLNSRRVVHVANGLVDTFA